MIKLTKVVFGKNSDRPEGEVQEVVEVGCFLQLFLLCLLLFIVVDVACSSSFILCLLLFIVSILVLSF